MMKEKIIPLIAIFALFALLGCVSEPAYQFCCDSKYAFPDDSSNPVCHGTDENGELQELSVVSCDDEGWVCNVTINEGEDDETTLLVPVCPKIDTIKCNTSCAGVFCGRFFFDPRPGPQSYPMDEAHCTETDESVEMDFSDKSVGLWGAKCIVEDMDEEFLRKLENLQRHHHEYLPLRGGGFVQDFETAQYYFPITDKACMINRGGDTDRYIVYAIPNEVGYGSELC